MNDEKRYDPYHPCYHFSIDGCGSPGDPNGAFFADGVYHLMFLYYAHSDSAYHWGHVSSKDLIHWEHHPDALTGHKGDGGAYSGGAFVDDDGTAYLTFWKFSSKEEGGDAGGIALARSKPPYVDWERMEPIAIECCRETWGLADVEVDGEVRRVSCSDPSNIWKKDGYYYLQAGNLNFLIKEALELGLYPALSGDYTDLFRSKDLKDWQYVGRFYENDHTDKSFPDTTEDDMCPSFLPLFDAKQNGSFTGKYLQLFLSHNKGAHYYVGTLDGERFIPESHARMSWSECPWLDPQMWGKAQWSDLGFFAPEALVDGKNRQIVWAWLHDNIDDDYKKFGWTGIYSLPRVVWLEDGILKIAPVPELDALQGEQYFPCVTDGGAILVTSDTFRLKATIANTCFKAGFCLHENAEDGSRAEVYYDPARQKLVFDIIGCGPYENSFREEAPFALAEGESLELDVFADRSVIEVFANERQAICRRVFPKNVEAANVVRLIGDKSAVKSLVAYDMGKIEVK